MRTTWRRKRFCALSVRCAISIRRAPFTPGSTIAANQARNFLRKRKRENAFSIDDDENGAPLEKDSELADQALDADPVRGAHITDIKKRLRKALNQLSPSHREVVTLCDIMGLSYQEISKMLHVSEGTLRSRIFYAHKQLQSLLGDLER